MWDNQNTRLKIICLLSRDHLQTSATDRRLLCFFWFLIPFLPLTHLYSALSGRFDSDSCSLRVMRHSCSHCPPKAQGIFMDKYRKLCCLLSTGDACYSNRESCFSFAAVYTTISIRTGALLALFISEWKMCKELLALEGRLTQGPHGGQLLSVSRTQFYMMVN